MGKKKSNPAKKGDQQRRQWRFPWQKKVDEKPKPLYLIAVQKIQENQELVVLCFLAVLLAMTLAVRRKRRKRKRPTARIIAPESNTSQVEKLNQNVASSPKTPRLHASIHSSTSHQSKNLQPHIPPSHSFNGNSEASAPSFKFDRPLGPEFEGCPIPIIATRRNSGGSVRGSISGDDTLSSIGDQNSVGHCSTSSANSAYHLRRSVSRSNSIGSCCSCESINDGSTIGSLEFYERVKPAYLNIFFATQSGKAAYFASQLQREGAGMGFDIAIRSVKTLNLQPPYGESLRKLLIPHTTKSGKPRGRVVFVVSTYHEGGPTDDAAKFVTTLESLQENCLQGLRYSVFGIGDSSYSTTYNAQGKFYDRVLEQLGAKRLVPLGLGDASKDADYDFEHWKWTVFWPKFADLSAKDCKVILTSKGGQGSGEETQPTTVKRKNSKLGSRKKSLVDDPEGAFVLEVIEGSDSETARQCHDVLATLHPTSRHFVRGQDCHVKRVKPLWRNPDLDPNLPQPGSVMHVDFDLEDEVAPFVYSTGDNIAVLPINRMSVVEAVAEHLDYDLNTTFVLLPNPENKSKTFEPPFPSPCTVREYLSFYAELSTPPLRSVLRKLSKFATIAYDREELHRLGSSKNIVEFKQKVLKENIGLADIITMYFPSIRIPLVNFIRLCSPLQSRWYSASSSSVVSPKALSVSFSVITIPRTIDDSLCQGVCSHYMANLGLGDRVRLIRMGSSGFVAPPDPTTPLIMVCTGTGIAPMRALLQERHYQKQYESLPVGRTELFFGIRRKESDFLYRHEIEDYLQKGTLAELHLACSREQHQKVYIQDVLAEKEDHLWELLESGAHIYVCGASAMSSDVDRLLTNLIEDKLGSEDRAQAYIENLAVSKRYVREGWSGKTEIE